MKISETFQKELWLVGENEILEYLEEKKFVNLSLLKKESPWTQQGVLEVRRIKEHVEYLFLYPKVW